MLGWCIRTRAAFVGKGDFVDGAGVVDASGAELPGRGQRKRRLMFDGIAGKV